jgi:hypothetical protein
MKHGRKFASRWERDLVGRRADHGRASRRKWRVLEIARVENGYVGRDGGEMAVLGLLDLVLHDFGFDLQV